MKKIRYLAICMVLAISGNGYADECAGVTIDAIEKHIRIIPNSEIVAMQPVYGMCEVVLGYKKIESSPDYAGYYSFLVAPDYVMSARVFSYGEESKGLMADVERESFLKIRKKMDSLVFARYEPKGGVENDLYVFTSTKCGFCKRLESDLKKIADDTNTRIHMILFPIHGDDNAKKILCRGVTFDQYISHTWEKYDAVPDGCPESKNKIENALTIGRSLGINGTPTMFTGDGEKIVGADNGKIYRALSR